MKPVAITKIIAHKLIVNTTDEIKNVIINLRIAINNFPIVSKLLSDNFLITLIVSILAGNLNF